MSEQQIQRASQHLALGAVAIVGAGLSINARFPMTGGLNTLLWEALDSDQAARRRVAEELGRPDVRSKDLIGDEWDDVVIGWRRGWLESGWASQIQNQFAQVDADRAPQPSPAHEGLACLIHAGIVQRVISLNWDTALECAYRRLTAWPYRQGCSSSPTATQVARENAGHSRTKQASCQSPC